MLLFRFPSLKCVLFFHFYLKNINVSTKETLVQFERVRIAAQETESVSFEVTDEMLQLTSYEGDYQVFSGTHHFDMWRGNGDKITIDITV